MWRSQLSRSTISTVNYISVPQPCVFILSYKNLGGAKLRGHNFSLVHVVNILHWNDLNFVTPFQLLQNNV
jgi:hypothetical protein